MNKEMLLHLKKFSERLVESRVARRLTQRQFAEIAKVTLKTHARYEAGERFPDVEYLINLSEVGIDIYYLILGVSIPSNDEELEITNKYRNSNKTIKDVVKTILNNHSNIKNNTETNTDLSNQTEINNDVSQIIKDNKIKGKKVSFKNKTKKNP